MCLTHVKYNEFLFSIFDTCGMMKLVACKCILLLLKLKFLVGLLCRQGCINANHFCR